MQRAFWCVVLVVIAAAGWASPINDRAPLTVFNPSLRMGGGDELLSTGCSGIDVGNQGRQALDAVGSMYMAGTTWYDYQHNGSEGKMISVDDFGFVHMVWMKGMNSANDPRHVYYEVWDPTTRAFVPQITTGGVQVDNADRAGYVTQVVLPSGWCFPAYHFYKNTLGDNSLPHAGSAIDTDPGIGIFSSWRPANILIPGGAMQILWPKIALGHDSTLHVVAFEQVPTGVTQYWRRVYYSRGHPVWSPDGYGLRIDWDDLGGVQWKVLDTLKMLSPVIVVSPVSNRMAIVMSRTRVFPGTRIDSAYVQDNDIMMYISEDGGNNWGQRINVTNFAWADYDCVSGDTAVCNRDTFRTYDDCAALFDLNDNLHVAFEAITYRSLQGNYGPIFTNLWHWSEGFGEFSPVAHVVTDTLDWNASNLAGANQMMTQRPNLALDPVTGYLYCAYQQYDSIHLSHNGYPQGDAMVAMSRNCGRTWSVGTNVTETGHAGNPLQNFCQSERNITVSDYVTYENGHGYLNMEYVLDLDAGSCIQTAPQEGTCTNNPVYYQRIPVDSIPALPLLDWTFPVLHVDSTGFPGRVIPLPDPMAINPCPTNAVGDYPQAFSPNSFKLYQNYPNPFNPTTNIQFDLPRSARVTLKVFNVLGEEVTALYNNKSLNAGVQRVTFDASALASGVYIYRLDVAGISAARKMVVMK